MASQQTQQTKFLATATRERPRDSSSSNTMNVGGTYFFFTILTATFLKLIFV